MSKKSWLAWASTRRRLLQNTVNPVKPCSFYSQDETLNLVWSQKYDLTRSLIVGPPPSLAGWKACSAVRCRQGAFLCCAWLGTPSPTAPCGLLSISISPYFIIISFYICILYHLIYYHYIIHCISTEMGLARPCSWAHPCACEQWHLRTFVAYRREVKHGETFFFLIRNF